MLRGVAAGVRGLIGLKSAALLRAATRCYQGAAEQRRQRGDRRGPAGRVCGRR